MQTEIKLCPTLVKVSCSSALLVIHCGLWYNFAFLTRLNAFRSSMLREQASPAVLSGPNGPAAISRHHATRTRDSVQTPQCNTTLTN